LEQDTDDHNTGTGSGVANGCLFVSEGCGGSAYGLDDEGDQIGGAEDVEVHVWGDGGDICAECSDELAENYVYPAVKKVGAGEGSQ